LERGFDPPEAGPNNFFGGEKCTFSWENHGKIMGTSWENHGNIMGKSWENMGTYRKIWDIPDEYGGLNMF
jgi:hypothetical protein